MKIMALVIPGTTYWINVDNNAFSRTAFTLQPVGFSPPDRHAGTDCSCHITWKIIPPNLYIAPYYGRQRQPLSKMAKSFQLRDQPNVVDISDQIFVRRKPTLAETRLSITVQDTAHFENETLQFWKVFFDFGYWLLLNPFRFTFNAVTGHYEVRTGTIQKYLIIINDILTGIYFICKLRTKIVAANNPTQYYEISYYCCDTIYLTIMFYLFGRRADKMLTIFSDLQQTNREFSAGPQAYVKTKILATVLCTLCVGSMFCAIFEALLDAEWDPVRSYHDFEEDANHVFADVFKALSLPADTKPTFLTILSFWSTMFERIMNAYSDILFTMTALWFQTLVRSFLQLVRDPNTPPEKVIANFTRIRAMVEKTNDAMAVVIGSFVVGNLPFYVTNVFDVFSDANIFLRLRYLFYCSYYFPSLFLAAKSCKQMEEMKEWSCQVQNMKHMPYLEASLILSEVNFQPVALGSFGCLAVNFNLVGSMISIILTYALLKSQFQSNEKQVMVTSSATPFS